MVHFQQIISRTLVVLYNYAKLTNFFWMFVEGLYLHTLICWAYSSDNVQLWMYNIIGWGKFTYTNCIIYFFFNSVNFRKCLSKNNDYLVNVQL